MTMQEQLEKLSGQIDRLFERLDEMNAQRAAHEATTELRLTYLEKAVFGSLGALALLVAGVAWVLVKTWE